MAKVIGMNQFINPANAIINFKSNPARKNKKIFSKNLYVVCVTHDFRFCLKSAKWSLN